MDAGAFVEYQTGEATYIEASQPILIAQYNVGSRCSGHTLGDPSMVLLNSVEQTRDNVTLFNSSLRILQRIISILLPKQMRWMQSFLMVVN